MNQRSAGAGGGLLLLMGGIFACAPDAPPGPSAPLSLAPIRTLDLHSGELRRRFLDHAIDPSQRGLAVTVASVPIAVDLEGRIHALFSWSDTVRVFEKDGMPSGSIPLPIPGFSREGTLPDSTTLAGLRVVRSLSLAPDGRMMVHYTTPTATQGGERSGVLLLDPGGTLLHRLDPAPPLLAVRWPELFFGDSTGMHPGGITVMEYRD